MALYKDIQQDDGVTTSYHRILLVTMTTNKRNFVVVASYVNADSRSNEDNIDAYKPYCKTITYETDYDESMTVGKAYDFLKTIPIFDGALDV